MSDLIKLHEAVHTVLAATRAAHAPTPTVPTPTISHVRTPSLLFTPWMDADGRQSGENSSLPVRAGWYQIIRKNGKARYDRPMDFVWFDPNAPKWEATRGRTVDGVFITERVVEHMWWFHPDNVAQGVNMNCFSGAGYLWRGITEECCESYAYPEEPDAGVPMTYVARGWNKGQADSTWQYVFLSSLEAEDFVTNAERMYGDRIRWEVWPSCVDTPKNALDNVGYCLQQN